MDIQVRWFTANTTEEVKHAITDDPLESYLNDDAQQVTWELVEIFQVEPFQPTESGEEVVGLIAHISELRRLAE